MKLFKKTEKLPIGDKLLIDLLSPQVKKIKQNWVDYLSGDDEDTKNKHKNFKLSQADISKVLLLSILNHIHHLEADMLSKKGFLALGAILVAISSLLRLILPF